MLPEFPSLFTWPLKFYEVLIGPSPCVPVSLCPCVLLVIWGGGGRLNLTIRVPWPEPGLNFVVQILWWGMWCACVQFGCRYVWVCGFVWIYHSHRLKLKSMLISLPLSLSLSTIAFPFSSLLLSQCLSVVLCKDDPCLLDCMQSHISISISLSGTLFVCALWSVNLVRMWLSLCHYRLTCGQDTLSEV